MAAALFRRDRHRVPARPAARVARGALPRRHAPGLAGRVSPGACGRSARRGCRARPRSRGPVDRSDSTERCHARLHDSRAGALPRGEGSDVRRVFTVAHGRRRLLERRPHPGSAVNDRALQDDVIRALAVALYRASAEWRGRGLADAGRVERFARFLARHFYHERIVHFFKYSRALARVTARWPEAVLRQPGFDALLSNAVLGERATARAVARLVIAYVAGEEVPYHGDLLRYQEAMMVVEAGPRVWRDTSRGDDRATVAPPPPELVEGTELLELEYDLPSVLPQLLQPWTTPPDAPRRKTSLIVARSRHGRVAVARASDAIASVVRFADGARTVDDLARAAGLRPGEISATLRDSTEIGAVRFST